MNETLKGVAHIGAELAAAKADLQREMERHRKTWRQLEQVTGLLREINDSIQGGGRVVTFMDDDIAAITAALSQQAEPLEPAPAQDELVSASDVTEALEFYEKATKRFVVPKGVSEHQDQFVQGWLAKAEHTRPAQTAPQPEQSGLPREVVEAFRVMDAIPHSASNFDTPEIARAKDRLVDAVRAALSATPSPAMDADK